MDRTDQFIDIRHGYSLFKVSIPYPAGPVKVLKPLSGAFHVLHERTSGPVFRSLKILCIAQNIFHSADAVTVNFLRQAFLKGVESFHQVFELLMCQFPGLLFVARPVETIAGSQSLVQKKVSVSFKEKPLDPVTPASAEKEQRPFIKRIQPKMVLDHESE